MLMSAMSAMPMAGYEALYATHNRTVERTCWTVAGLSATGLRGAFILPSAAQFEMGEQLMQGAW